MNGFIFWRDVLGRVRDAHGQTSAVIAGGCIRDYMLGLEPKDIDVFINSAPNGNVPDGFEALHPLTERPEYEGMNQIVGVEDYRFEDTAINVVYVAALPSLYVNDNFDSRINQGVVTSAYVELPSTMMADLERKTYTIHKMSANSRARGDRFLQKMADIEPGWSVVIEDNEHNRRFEQPQENRTIRRIPQAVDLNALRGNNFFDIVIEEQFLPQGEQRAFVVGDWHMGV